MDERGSGFDGRTMAKAFLVQVVLVAVVSVILALLLPHSFFENWGWLSGPVAWLACAWGTSLILNLPTGRTILGAILVGIPSILFVVLRLHWLGALVAAVLFGAWCAYRPAEPTPA